MVIGMCRAAVTVAKGERYFAQGTTCSVGAAGLSRIRSTAAATTTATTTTSLQLLQTIVLRQYGGGGCDDYDDVV